MRGLAHLHGVISVESPAHARWAECYVGALWELAPAYGFGFVDIGRRSGGGSGRVCRLPHVCRALSPGAVVARSRSRRRCLRVTCRGWSSLSGAT